MMDNSDDIHLVSLPGAEETEPTTILEELNRNLIEPVVTRAADNDANENEHAHDLNIDNVTDVIDVGESNQLTQSQSEVTDEVNKDTNQIVHSEKSCDSDRYDGIEILNFNLQTVDDARPDERPSRTEPIDEVDNICKEDKNCDDVLVSSSDLKSDSKPSTSYHDDTGSLTREVSPPPVPLVTYRWEDVRRDKQKVRFEEGGYPWTYLEPHEPTVIVLNKDSQEEDQQKEHEELKSEESKDLEEVELNRVEEETDFEEKLQFESVPNFGHEPEKSAETKKQRSLPNFLKRALPSKKLDIQKANQSPSTHQLNSPTNSACCHPFVEKLKTMADKQLHKAKQYRTTKKHSLRDDERIDLSEPHQILKLKESPKADRKEIASYVVKQDSDDVLEIIDLDESPSEIRRNREDERSTIVSPDEIIELPLSQDTANDDKTDVESIEPTATEILESEVKNTPPLKSPRKQKEHVYEEIEPPQNDSQENDPLVDEFISHLSLRKEEDKANKSDDEIISTNAPESSIEPETDQDQKPPSSSIESTSDGKEKKIVPDSQEDSEQAIQDLKVSEKSDETKEPELKSLLKREASPCSDKKVTFSMSTEENSDEPHREDVDLPEHVKINSKWSKMSDHEYEPIGESNDTVPVDSASSLQDSPPQLSHELKTETQEDNSADAASITSHERKLLGATNAIDEEGDLQQDHIEEGILAPTPQTDHSRNDEICTSQVDSSAIEDLPLRREDRKKSFMASTSDKTRNVQRKLRNQAGRLKSKFKEMQKPKQEDSPTSERKRFRSPEFNKLKNIKMPKISKPELKRPEFTKFTTPKFKKPDFKFDGFSSLRLNRKKSTTEPSESISGESKITRTTEDTIPTKKRFDFGTYPRIFDRMRRDNRSGASGTTISRDTEPDEECDRVNVSGPILFSTVPRSKKDKKPIRSKWASGPSYADDENSSGKFKHYSLDRESSIEKRMRFDFKDSIDAEDEDGERGILQTEEQKQYADYDKENRAIHQISQAKEGEFRQRKPLVHQESDVVSEESNKELGWVDTDHLRNRLMAQSGDLDISQKEDYVNEVLPDHLSTQETQSSGSSSNRRRKGVIEEIDDDEFFLRKKGISQDDIQIGKYISAAIREGLDTPVNALAQLAQYDNYYDEDFDISNERVDYGYDVPPRKPRRVRDFEKSLSSEFNDNSGMAYNDEADHDEDVNISPDGQFFQTYPPSRPRRKTRKQQSEESHDEHEVPVAAQYYPHTDDDEHSFYENKHMEGIEQPDIKITYNEDTNLDIDYTPNEGQTPPKAPKRRKHLLRESVERDSLANNFVGRSISNSYLTNENAEETVVFRTEHEYVPLVQPETFTTPTPTPRSRSKASPLTDDDRTSRGAESLAFDETKFSTDLKEVNGYAVVKKEPPPRPPAPIRRKRSTRSLGDRQFFTMPLRRNQNDLVPERPVRNYSTIGPTRPIRPARRVSLNSLEKPPSITSDATQYEEIEDINHLGSADHRDNKTDQNYKMKHRPLPPPPRPPRERKHRKSSESDGNKLDKDGGGEKITSKNLLEDISRISSQDMEEIEEMERSTQTDPLPDDYLCEEFDINSDMPIIEPSFHRHSKTLEDILKEEQQAEMERARQIADENSLTKGIQKFREANQRSLSERSRGSTNDRPKTPSSRPITPSAVIIEKKTNLSTIETDAQLIVQPVDEDEVDTTTNISHRNRFFAEDTVDTEDERIVNEALKRYNLLDSDFRDSSPQRDIELNIREVEPPNQTQTNEVPQIPLEAPPQAPPRRKSSCTESTVVPIANENENVPIPEEDHADIESHSATMNLLPGNRLHINELEVEHLNVHDLQAGRILVSDLQAIAMSSQDIECTSGDLIVKGIKLPPGFLEELINRARTSAIDEHPTEHETSSQLVQESNQQTSNVVPLTEQNPIPANEQPEEPEPPARPPPPRSLYPSDYAPYSLPPPSFYQLRSYPDEIEEVLPHSPTTMHRQRRRYHRRRDSTSEEEEQREHRRSRQHSNRSPEPSIGDLSGQLMRACGSAIGRGGVKLYALMKERKQEMKRRDISIGVAILIFVVAFLMMIGIRGERTVHHHHWDYWNPPGSSGRP
ncbi:uncharacterized protein LOC119073249 isoform X2 [Bradysia coprophila]|uniref:uncharacterized protein LOC119073249 isoform X2 n=1 Tax=Bradysia coprophila TaxID=38358 RepID=UPI00187DA5E9|nr:uncharacterized protein LOC119073249 isoform X2 [Bradysia coprophila]